MFQLKILSGRKSGDSWEARRFPARVGRSSASDLVLEDDGIWDEHFEIDLDSSKAFVLASKSGGIVSVNREPMQQTALRNGDVIEVGSTKLQFWLGEVGQAGLRKREALNWALIIFVCLVQIGVIYLLLD